MLETCRTALKTFESLGCVVEEVPPPAAVEPAWQAFVKIRQWQQGASIRAYYADPDKRALLKPEAQWEAEGGLKLSAYDISAAGAVHTHWSNAVARLFDNHDYLVMPTAQVFAFDVNTHWPAEIAGQPMRTYHEWMKAICLISLAGCPALAAPAGFDGRGRAMGLQIIAPVHREMDCLRLAKAYEQALPASVKRLPPLLQA